MSLAMVKFLMFFKLYLVGRGGVGRGGVGRGSWVVVGVILVSQRTLENINFG